MNRAVDDKLTFLGDVFLPYAFAAEIPYQRIVLNLEYAITRHDTAAPGKVNLRSEESHLRATFGDRLSAVCLANNHVADYGDAGLRDTLLRLRADEIALFGAGGPDDRCNNPALVDVAGCTVALLGYVCPSTSPIVASPTNLGVSVIDPEAVRSDIERAKSRGADRVVVSFHWGAEEVSAVKQGDIAIARAAVDAGADLVIGHHAHCIQDMERYRDAYIFYGLGNCIFPDLAVGANYDPVTNLPARTYRKKQKPWNRKSLAITYAPAANAVQADLLTFNDASLTVRRSVDVTNLQPLPTGADFQRRYRRRFLFGRIRNTIFNFLYEPKMPGPRHLRGLWNLLHSTEYKRGA